MIPAHHNKIAHLLFRPYLHFLTKNKFHCVRVFGPLPEFPPDRSVLLLPNHSSWWDGFIIYLVNDLYWKKKPYVMMEEKQLKRFPYFNKLGAYSVCPGNKTDVEKSIIYTAELLAKPENLVFMFPQGKLLPWHQRPLVFKQGYKRILDSVSVKPLIYICGIRPEFTREQYPEIFLEFRSVNMDETEKDELTGIMENLLKNLENRIVLEEKGSLLFAGRKSLSE
jgi:1-acyl-sn-glycerol-3-phosphate acyltransferase